MQAHSQEEMFMRQKQVRWSSHTGVCVCVWAVADPGGQFGATAQPNLCGTPLNGASLS